MSRVGRALGILAAARHVRLTTYRRNGSAVGTPVWISREGPRLYVWTRADSGKVTRLRRDRRVQVAPSDVRGRPLGPAHDGTARLLDPAATRHVERLHRRKYGLRFAAFRLGSRVARRWIGDTVGIEITLRDPDGQGR